MVIVGIDLAGSPRRPTGICLLNELQATTNVVYENEEIVEVIEKTKPDLIPIDAPLTLPCGRTTIHDRSGEHLRDCDRELQRRKIKFFPITLGPMRMLTERGMLLCRHIKRMGYRMVECYPGAAQDIWSIPRQRHDLKGLVQGLRKLGVRGLKVKMTGDELDAVTAALVGRWFLLGQGEMLGGKNGILVPLVQQSRSARTTNSVGLGKGG